MAAPSGTVWGSVVNDYGRIGLYITTSSTNTHTTATIQIWFWSKYSVSDTSNTLRYNEGTAASTNRGSVNIRTTVDSGGGWSTSNQVRIASTTVTHSRATNASNWNFTAQLEDVDRVGGTMRVTSSWTTQALTRYTVSYNANGGSGAPRSQTKYYGYNLTLSNARPTRTGYTFQGWATSSNGSVAYDPGDTYSANASVTLYAVWSRSSISITLNASQNGGTVNGSESISKTINYGGSYGALPTAVRNGYDFVGWNTRSDGTGTYITSTTKFTTNTTLYAIFESSSVAWVKQNGTYIRGEVYVKQNGTYIRGEIYVKQNGIYLKGGA